jgi:asparagine synthase (glutamine-hydrolysing)
MAHGLEVRPPLLDDALIDRSFALPSRYKVQRGSGKVLLKLAARGKVPDEIIDRPKKGFGIPLATWLRGPLRERIEEVVARSPVFDRALLDGEVFRSWNKLHQKKRADHSKPLWALLVLDHWFRRNLGAVRAHG